MFLLYAIISPTKSICGACVLIAILENENHCVLNFQLSIYLMISFLVVPSLYIMILIPRDGFDNNRPWMS